MTTATSYSEKSRFKYLLGHLFRSSAAYAIISSLVCIIAMPVVYITNIFPNMRYYLHDNIDTETLRAMINSGQGFVRSGIVVVAILMILTAMAAVITNGYLYSKPMTDFYHSLPSSRGQLFNTRFLAVCSSILAPFYVVLSLVTIFEVSFFGRYGLIGTEYFVNLVKLLVLALTGVVMMYLFCALICVNVGTPLDALAAIGTIGLMPMIVYSSVRGMFSTNIYGAGSMYYGYDFTVALSPATFPFYIMLTDIGEGNYLLRLFVGVVITALMYILAQKLYLKRKSELAEQTKTQSKLQAFVKCSAAYCGGLSFYYSFNATGVIEIFIYTMMGAVMFGIVAEIIMSRGVKMIRRNLLLIAAAGFATCLVFGAVMQDWFGYETYVPEDDKIAGVSIDYPSYTSPNYWYNDSSVLTEPQNIALITEVHRELTQHHENNEYFWDDYARSSSIEITYTLKNGRIVRRRYNEIYYPAAMRLARLNAEPEFIRQNHIAFMLEEFDVSEYYDLEAAIYDSMFIKSQSLMLNEGRQSELLAAVRADILAQSFEEIANPSKPSLGRLTLNLSPRAGVNYDNAAEFLLKNGYSLRLQVSTFELSESMTNTMSLLELWGETELLKPDLGRVDEMMLVIDGGEYINFNLRRDASVQLVDENMRNSYSSAIERVFYDRKYNIGREEYYGDIAVGVTTTAELVGTESYLEDYGTYTIEVAPEDFEALDNLARTQLLFSRQDIRMGKVGFLFMLQNGQVIGGKLVLLENLPDELSAKYNIAEYQKAIEDSRAEW